MRGPSIVRAAGSEELAGALRTWCLVALRAPGAHVCLAVGASTLPLYGAFPPDDPAWESKRILPLDEVADVPVEQSFSARLALALPERLRARCAPLVATSDPAVVEDALASGGICAAVLGLGPDGHIAFNQPGDDETTVTRVVELTLENRARIGNIATRALTIGVATILRAAHLALVVSGDGKDAALTRVLDGPPGSDSPASLLRAHPSLTVFIGASS